MKTDFFLRNIENLSVYVKGMCALNTLSKVWVKFINPQRKAITKYKTKQKSYAIISIALIYFYILLNSYIKKVCNILNKIWDKPFM